MFMHDITVSDAERLHLAAQALEKDAAFQMDEDTFRSFYDRTSRPVWSYLSRITGDRQLADDLLQETYYRFLRAPNTRTKRIAATRCAASRRTWRATATVAA